MPHQPTLTDVWEGHLRDLLVSVDLLNRHAKAKPVRLAAQRVLEAWEDTHTALMRLDVTLARVAGGESGEVPGRAEVEAQEAHRAGLSNPPPTHVQTIIFTKEQWTVAKARRWLREHGKKAGKVDVQANTLRFRQRPPSDFRSGEFAVISFGEPERGIQALVGHLKEGGGA